MISNNKFWLIFVCFGICAIVVFLLMIEIPTKRELQAQAEEHFQKTAKPNSTLESLRCNIVEATNAVQIPRNSTLVECFAVEKQSGKLLGYEVIFGRLGGIEAWNNN